MDSSVFKWTKSETLFTVLVLLVVWIVSFFQLKTGQSKTRDAQRKADVELVGRALDRYFEDYKVYPPSSPDSKIVSCGDHGLLECAWGEDDIVDYDNVAYLRKIPVEPFTYKNWRYVYETDAERKHYKIYVALEYRGDPAWKADLTVTCGPRVQCRWYVGR